MDTRLKKFKYTLSAKILCLILSAICIFAASCSAFMFLQAGTLFGFSEYLKGNTASFYECRDFNNQISQDIYRVSMLSSESSSSIDAQLTSQAEKKVSEAVNAYLDLKAEIIRSELEYAVNNYDESYFDYEYSADLVTIPETTVPAHEQSTMRFEPVSEFNNSGDTSDENLPRNVEAAKKILETVSGRGFLDYEALVRNSAFDRDFSYGIQLEAADNNYVGTAGEYFFIVDNMMYSESQIKSNFSAQYNDFKRNYISSYDSDLYSFEDELNLREYLKYYVANSNGTVYTNLTAKPEMNLIVKQEVYVVSNGTNTEIKGIKDNETLKNVERNVSDSTGKELYVFLDNGFREAEQDDIYSDMYRIYLMYTGLTAEILISVFAVTLILALALLIVLLRLCGHTNKQESPATATIDKLPTDIHFVISGALITLSIMGIIALFSMPVWNYNIAYTYSLYCFVASSAVVTLIWLIFIEWLASVVRIKKCGFSFFRRTLFVKIIKRMIAGIRSLKKRIAKDIAYRPKRMQKLTILFIVGYVIINFMIMIFTAFFNYFFYEGIVAFICMGVLTVFNTLVVIFLMKYIRMFDDIITASSEHRNVDFGSEKVPVELKILADNLSNSNQQLDEAIAKAIRDEQMKTELITNVSHDLKTPLTSLITYSDLLSKCEITDENAIKYTDVIHQQSIKLKRLIEDLIEASKVSTGNITLDKSVLNLSELAIQAIVEFSPETEKNGNEIKFDQPETAPKVYADGAKTYRIIANLLNNAKKYSAPNTRIYVSVYTDGINGYFEIKNISAEPLNISPDELTERFVRGDKSRSREGNGLGLSIAKDLCTIQDGELRLIIDGDLFKAIVKLPCKQEETEITEDSTIQPE